MKKYIYMLILVSVVFFIAGCSKQEEKVTILNCETTSGEENTIFRFTYDESGKEIKKIEFKRNIAKDTTKKDEEIKKDLEDSYCYRENGERYDTCDITIKEDKVIIELVWPLDELFEMPFDKNTELDKMNYVLSNTGPDVYTCEIK